MDHILKALLIKDIEYTAQSIQSTTEYIYNWINFTDYSQEELIRIKEALETVLDVTRDIVRPKKD